jgi:hypothetical protein
LNLATSIISKQLLSRQWDKKYYGSIFLESLSLFQRFTKTKTSPKRFFDKRWNADWLRLIMIVAHHNKS